MALEAQQVETLTLMMHGWTVTFRKLDSSGFYLTFGSGSYKGCTGVTKQSKPRKLVTVSYQLLTPKLYKASYRGQLDPANLIASAADRCINKSKDIHPGLVKGRPILPPRLNCLSVTVTSHTQAREARGVVVSKS